MFAIAPVAHGQPANSGSPEEVGPDPGAVAKATDFSIPQAPAFALLDLSPSNVHTPAYPRDFKVDWILNEDQLASNIAIQAAPIWIFFARDLTAAKYQEDVGYLQRRLYSMDVSVATAAQSGDRFLSAAVKINLLDTADPLADPTYTTNLSEAVRAPERQTRLQNQIGAIAFKADGDTTYSDAQKGAIEALANQAGKFGEFNPESIEAYTNLPSASQDELASLVSRFRALHQDLQAVVETIESRVQAVKQAYEREHWNATCLDVAGGYVGTYDSPQVDNLSLRDRGWGGWINGATGFGSDRVLMSGMARAITTDTAGDPVRYFAGVNLRYRYGASLNNVFVEYIRRVGDQPNRHEIAYGGSVDLTERLNVQFGLRTSYNDDLDLRALLPTIKLNGKASDLLGAL